MWVKLNFGNFGNSQIKVCKKSEKRISHQQKREINIKSKKISDP
jgi:hypothetical protein